ncbi:peroxiredoxin [Candidatus Woesearchaeota archaeon]|nr:peroxiredoxin [Candidatus Woesearchaeota archaeon]
MTLEKGIQAPEFCLQDANHEQRCLKDYKGQWVILYFYPADDTPGCTTEASEFTSLAEEFKAKGATVLGVSPDSCESHQQFMDKHELNVTLLSDSNKEVAQQYEASDGENMVRSTVLIDPEGTVVHHWPNVSAGGHAAAVLEMLKSLV